ncbi:uncharacterized protein [Oryza sativa Japonica Group]|jgi:hypothetical protein|uniref:Os09g0467700 protein n=2 Tax=Oryza sativa subsp. japonica TaxID=39947 RepID=Q0J124_ORYSJ|nr:uncharacterized protein LOC4347323 [Oryza sativa Japonica Group]BAF25341.1 Os09g0467700 [Oryza sativa Japonica Group]BAG88032.1 unnamed protein product [Oryza sativa Japonica Group]BAT08531.1 Os09g0467700 [Oryza sativa Japonica Group]|eukprot:NP_001063427.1 Os09g0467700 [Oryza sativa Japonica Group]
MRRRRLPPPSLASLPRVDLPGGGRRRMRRRRLPLPPLASLPWVDPPGGGGGGSHGQIRRRQLLPPLLASLPRVDLPGGGGHGQIRRRRHLLRVDPATAASSAASLLPPARWSRVDPTVVASTEGGSGNGGFLRRLSSPSGAMVVPDGGSGGRGVNFCDVCYSCCYSWM